MARNPTKKPTQKFPPPSARVAALLAVQSALEDLADVEATLARACQHIADAGLEGNRPELGAVVDVGAVVRVVAKELRDLASKLEEARRG